MHSLWTQSMNKHFWQMACCRIMKKIVFLLLKEEKALLLSFKRVNYGCSCMQQAAHNVGQMVCVDTRQNSIHGCWMFCPELVGLHASVLF